MSPQAKLNIKHTLVTAVATLTILTVVVGFAVDMTSKYKDNEYQHILMREQMGDTEEDIGEIKEEINHIGVTLHKMDQKLAPIVDVARRGNLHMEDMSKHRKD